MRRLHKILTRIKEALVGGEKDDFLRYIFKIILYTSKVSNQNSRNIFPSVALVKYTN
jgi:hypothetical protein